MATPTPETAIWLALKIKLQALTLSPGLTIAYPNEDFTPPTGDNYLSTSLFRNDPLAATMGGTGKTRHMGIFQIMLHAKRNQDFAVAQEIAGDIANHFELGTSMTNNGFTVRVERPPSVGSDISRADEPLMLIPISIRWIADATRGA